MTKDPDKRAAPRAERPRTDAFTFIVHWGLVAALVVSLITGLRIATDTEGSVAGALAGRITAVLPEGAVIDWHVWSSWALFFVALAYAVFLWRSRQGVRVKVDRSVADRIVQARRRGGVWSSRPAWFAINVLVYQLAFLLIALMVVTGLMLYSGRTFGLGSATVATVHGISAYVFVAYVVLHVFSQVKAGVFWKVFRPRLAYTAAAAVALLVAGSAVAAFYVVDRSDFRTLAVERVETAPVLDGDPGDPAWQAAEPVAIATDRGANLPGGAVTVEVRAVHDGEHAWFMFRWADPQRSQKHLPLVKTEAGWQVMQSEYEINDEDDYYEDKFSVVLAHRPALGSGTAHLGQNLIAGPHRPTTRGLHYTADGSVADMWHWKSVRTGGMGLVDDNQFGPPQPSEKPGARYTAGYDKDPEDSGGYTENWTKLDEDAPLTGGLVVPKFLPADPVILERLGTVDLDPTAQDDGIWYLLQDEVVPYDPALDTYPVGTVLPAVVIEGPFTGDRGDLPAGAEWRDGMWTLEVSRKLDTGSPYDVALRPGEDVYLWVAAFNHTQTRHSQHLHPVRVAIQ